MRLDKKYNNVVPKYMKPKKVHISPSLNRIMLLVDNNEMILIDCNSTRLFDLWLRHYKIFKQNAHVSQLLPDCEDDEEYKVYTKKQNTWYDSRGKTIDRYLIMKDMEYYNYKVFKNIFDYNKYLIARELAE